MSIYFFTDSNNTTNSNNSNNLYIIGAEVIISKKLENINASNTYDIARIWEESAKKEIFPFLLKKGYHLCYQRLYLFWKISPFVDSEITLPITKKVAVKEMDVDLAEEKAKEILRRELIPFLMNMVMILLLTFIIYPMNVMDEI